MTKHIHPGQQVTHLWANQSQDWARNSSGSVSFRDSILFSYRSEIARIVPGAHGNVALITTEKWGPTTAKHKSWAWRATSYGATMPTFEVPFFGYTLPIDHEENIETWKEAYVKAIHALERSRDHVDHVGIVTRLEEPADTARKYCAAFGLELPAFFNPERDAAKIAEKLSRRFTPEKLAAREEESRKREEESRKREEARQREWERKNAEALAAYREGIEAWRRGERDTAPYMHHVPGHGFAYRPAAAGIALRVDPSKERIQTSWGAEVPIKHALRLFPLIASCKRTGRDWEKTGALRSEVELGHFTADRIDADGTLHAGCHVIPWSEIERTAERLKELGYAVAA